MKKTISELKEERVRKEIWICRRAVKIVHRQGWAYAYDIYESKQEAKDAIQWDEVTEFIGKYVLEEK